MHRHVRLALAASLSLGLAGCAALGELAKSTMKTPTLTFVKVDVASLDFEGATLALDYRVDNPNGFGLTLARVQYWLELEGRVVTRGEVAGGLTIPASGAAPVRFTARLPWAEVPHLLQVAQRRTPVSYAVGGTVAIDSPVGIIELPARHQGTVALPALPAFRLDSVNVRLASLTDVELDVVVGVSNPNPFPLPQGSLRYALAAGGEVVASSDLEGLAAVAAGGEGRLTIPVRLSILGAGRAAATALRGGSTDVRLTGEARLGALPIPLDLSRRSGR